MAAKSVVRGLAVMALAFARGGRSLASTDTITWGGDNSRSGYFPYVQCSGPGPPCAEGGWVGCLGLR